MSRRALALSLSFMLLTLIGCNACFNIPYGKYGNNSFNGNQFQKSEEAEQRLLEYISHRTVRIAVMCKITNTAGELIKGYHSKGWGTGAIVSSLREYSYIQTANHVVSQEIETSENLIRTCDKFEIERRDITNTITYTYRGKVQIVAKDTVNDIAVLKVFENMKISSTIAKDISLGESIRLLGYPYLRAIEEQHLSYSKGYIATLNMGKKNSILNADNQMRIATFGYLGNSGGAVWNTKGEIVGIVTLITGFPQFSGEIIPQNDCVYGPSYKDLIKLYENNNLNIVLVN
jgi:S1-C subfamily serine protease